MVGEETWVACATPGESDLSSIFQLDPRTAEWRKGESVVATQAGSAARAPALWFSTRAFTAGRPVVVYDSPLGIASR